ncbi:MAG: hypothetical protein KAR44_07545 [Candidatus Aegiribacteria sp.]|nr:hypothetical protein [Candidatus Aegiribacteria sp.]
MTGLAAHMDYLYVSSRSQNRTYRYLLPGISGRTNSTPFGGNSRTWDIARDSMGLIWVATDDSGIPVRCCDSSGNTVVEVGSNTISSATGVTLDDEGHLWVSNNDDMLLYRIDVTE